MDDSTHQVINLIMWFALSGEISPDPTEFDEYGKAVNNSVYNNAE